MHRRISVALNIIPSEVCGGYVPTVNHGEQSAPTDGPAEQLAWRVPITVRLNMTLLRSTQPVITVAEYLRLHNIPEEASDGGWIRGGKSGWPEGVKKTAMYRALEAALPARPHVLS